MATSGDDTIGVEEEFFLVDATTSMVVPRGSEVIEAGHGEFEAEFHQSLIENASPVCADLHQLRDGLQARRATLTRLAAERGLQVISAGSAPLADLDAQQVTEKPRFRRMLDDYQQVGREQLICGSQTHVGFVDRDESIEVMNRVRTWLPVLLALSASSPYFAGSDTGFNSYRTQVWSRWPTSGMPSVFGSWREYQDVTSSLVDGGAISDTGMLYWWLRPSQHAPTLEFRIADAATTVDEAVMLAGLSRGVARRARREVRDGRPPTVTRPEWLSVATWRAGRFGLDGELLDPLGGGSVPAGHAVRSLLDHAEHDIGDQAERDLVVATAERVLAGGNSATRQRAVYDRHGRIDAVVGHLADETSGDHHLV